MAYKIDDGSKEMLYEKISRLAESYTPEWKFDRKNPDAGSVIAMIFANQAYDNIRCFPQVLEKYHTEFVNLYGVSPKPAVPAGTVAVFSGSERTGAGTLLAKGTRLLGDNEDGEEIVFETGHDLFVSNARLTEIAAISGSRGKAVPYLGDFKVKNFIDGSASPAVLAMEESGEVKMFACEGENMDRQALVLGHKILFQGAGDGLLLRFHGSRGQEELAELLTDPGKFCFSYVAEAGLKPFDRAVRQGDCVLLARRGEEKRVFVKGTEMSLVVLEARDSFRENLEFTDIEIVTRSRDKEPDFVYDGTSELSKDSFEPFGRQISMYQECYIGQEYMMEQEGALMEISFDLSFEKYQVREEGESGEKDLPIIKRKKAAAGRLYRECLIQEVSLEYFNGKGYKKLPCEPDIEALFSREENAGPQKFRFVVPYDWESTVQGGYEQRCIRLQVKRADNCYLREVTHCVPVISGCSIQLSYRSEGTRPGFLKRFFGMQEAELRWNGQPFLVFSKSSYEGNAMLFGFNRRMEEGPVCLFFELLEGYCSPRSRIRYSYSTARGFAPLKVIDNTRNLQNSGTLMFLPPMDMARMELWGVKRFWIRMEDMDGYFDRENCNHPILKQIHMNAAQVYNVETKEEQEYYLDAPAANMSFPLYASNILSAEVWVNEREQLMPEQMERMLKEQPGEVRAEYNFLGEIEEFYLLWREVEQFDTGGKMERCYMIDRQKNRIVFGDGISVKIPQNTGSVAFRVRVRCCCGADGNVPSGSIGKFKGNALTVESVTNPVAAAGGSNMEDLKETLQRGSNILGARRRLVSEADYVREARLFSRLIDKAACVSGEYMDGEKDDSLICIVLLMRDYRQGSYSFRMVQEPLRQHFLNSCEMAYRKEELQVVEPVFVSVSLELWLTVPNLAQSIELKQMWLERLEAFLDPLNDWEHSGWEIGKLPRENQVRIMLGMVAEGSYVTRYAIRASYQDARGKHETGLDEIEVTPFMVCRNGNHQIHILEEEGLC